MRCADYAQDRFGNPFKPWEFRVARKLANKFWTSKPSLRRWSTEEELVFDCLTHWWLKRDLWRKDGGASLQSFMHTVVSKYLLQVVRGLDADRRSVNHHAVLFSDHAESENDERTCEDLAEEATAQFDLEPDFERKDAIAKVILELTGRQRAICELIQNEIAMTDIADRLRISRSTVHADAKRIRILFSNKGLQRFVE